MNFRPADLNRPVLIGAYIALSQSKLNDILGLYLSQWHKERKFSVRRKRATQLDRLWFNVLYMNSQLSLIFVSVCEANLTAGWLLDKLKHLNTTTASFRLKIRAEVSILKLTLKKIITLIIEEIKITRKYLEIFFEMLGNIGYISFGKSLWGIFFSCLKIHEPCLGWLRAPPVKIGCSNFPEL